MGFQSFVLSGVWVVGPMLGGVLAEAYGVRNAFFLAGLGISLCSVGYSQLPETLHTASRLATTRQGASEADVSEADASTTGAHGALGHHRAHRRRPLEAEDPPASRISCGAASGNSSAPAAPPSALPASLAAMVPLLRTDNVQALSAMAVAASIGQGCFMTVLTLHAREAWGASPAEIGAMFSLSGLSYIAGMPVGSWLAARTGRKALIVPGLVVSNVTFALLPCIDTRNAFFALLWLSYVSSAITGPALSAFTAEVLPPASRGQAGAVSRTFGDLTSLTAPIALGLLADATSCGTAIVASSTLCSGCVAFFAWKAREIAHMAPRDPDVGNALGRNGGHANPGPPRQD